MVNRVQGFYVHRVHRWPDGEFLVEVSEGRDSADPGALGTKYKHLHESWKLNNPKEAAICAVRIRRQWEKDEPHKAPIELSAIGLVGELGVPSEEMTVLELFTWARRRYEAIPRCAHCDEPITGEAYKWYDHDEEYCREFCAEEAWIAWQEEVEDLNTLR